MLENYTPKEIALTMFHRNIIDEIEELEIGDLEYARGNMRRGDYLVLTDEEADDMWNESLDNYIEDVILPEIPKSYRIYFDSEKWKDDASYDGRGHSISSYDGVENEQEYDGITYFIYRMN